MVLPEMWLLEMWWLEMLRDMWWPDMFPEMWLLMVSVVVPPGVLCVVSVASCLSIGGIWQQ